MFLYASSVFSGTKDNFLANSRLYFPVGFGWMILGILALDQVSRNSVVTSLRFYSLAIPLGFSFSYYAALGAFGHPYAAMPNTGLYWATDDYDQDHAAFLSRVIKERGKGPDLAITQEARTMLELGAPIYWRYIFGWPRVLQQQGSRSLGDDRAGTRKNLFFQISEGFVHRTVRSAGFPFKFYILKFVAEKE